MKHHESVAQLSVQLKSMFTAAGGLLLIALLVTIIIEMGFEQSVPTAVYVIMGVLLLGIFAFYGLNIFAMMRISTAPVKKEVRYRNSELEIMTALSVHQATHQMSILQAQASTLPSSSSATFVKQKTLRQRKAAPALAPTGQYPVIEHEANETPEPTIPANNVVPIRPLADDDDEVS